MHVLNDNPLWEAFGLRALARTAYGGADIGECFSTMERIGNGTRENWYREWIRTAERVYASAWICESAGHGVSAREAYFRACTYFHLSYFPLFGAPVDPWLVDAAARETDAFHRGAALSEFPIEPVEVPYENTSLPGYFVRPQHAASPAPTLLHLNGYDSNIQEMYFAHAPAAVRRGYNCLLLDGPGQGRNLIRDDMVLRPDSEAFVHLAIDYLLTRPEVDPQRIVLSGWSFGGYLACRAAAHERRIAALIVDPGLWDQKVELSTFRLPADLSAPAEPLNIETFADLESKLDSAEADQLLRWRIFQRDFWVHGVSSLRELAGQLQQYEISSTAGRISCPTLITAAEGDPLSAQATALYEALRCPKQLLCFSSADGAGGRYETLGRTLHHQRMFDWLDEILRLSTPPRLERTG